ncbi:hypothetical protein G7Y89_g13570 [Cudoniella acicularis]|uniref:NACHT domain-containing protein n=1 Tax=Cudoniella acicularis TaxID=354080 RepID=A0A8H4VY42_9HELO|nr:hypothetical protein G7Y89_g13570 [Cudoniella acicularis]
MAPTYPTRPKQTEDLVQRLKSRETNLKEVDALQALSEEMIKEFTDHPKPSYVPEAAALASVVTAKHYQDLLRAFENAVIKGNADGNVLDPQLLIKFAFVLRCSERNRDPEIKLGVVLKSLYKRISDAEDEAERQTTYELLCALSFVLDAMNDVKTNGLKRETLHEPLLTQLATLRESNEPRLAQAASYAYQALLGIPDNEGPYKKLWRHFSVAAVGAAKVASAIWTADPTKLIDGLTQLWDLQDLLTQMVTIVKAVPDVKGGIGSVVQGTKLPQKQKSWYVALRFTDMLIYAEAFKDLENFVVKVPCTWEVGNSSAKNKIVQFLEDFLIAKALKSKQDFVLEWVQLIAETLGQSDWKASVESAPRQLHLPWRKKKELKSMITRHKVRNEPFPPGLLERAWLNSDVASVFYADIELLRQYATGPHLQIERISGDRLSMDQCYINLAIVKHSQDEGTTRQSSPFSLSARMKVEKPGDKNQVQLSELFSPLKQSGGTTKQSRRILIRGRAGVGKTTLCKKMVHEFIHHDSNEFLKWRELFDHILWVPLRNLKHWKGTKYDLEQLFREEYFSQHQEVDRFAEALDLKVRDFDDSRSLFILDGLDEVSQEFRSNNQMSKFLEGLLNMPNVVITSRPYGIFPDHIHPLDLELETIGFYPDQVKTYVEKAFTDPKTGEINSTKIDEVQSFLQRHWLIQSLVRIPIQLDALCYTWDADFSSKPPTETMTALYEAIELKLWWKDIPRLEKRRQGHLVTEDDIRDSRTPSQIYPLVKEERYLLEVLAFTGLYNDIINFEQNNRDEIYEHFPLQEMGASFDNTLAKLSFLRTSGVSSRQLRHQNYHFLHLSFQEYFTAQYFVRQWISGRLIECLKLKSGKIEHIDAEDFLRKEKYNPRYDILWRFVAGLLHDESQLCRFFETIEDQPRDLFGPIHQRLVMHCLSEVVPSQGMLEFNQLRKNLERRLVGWVVFECNLKGYSHLAAETEFSEQLLEVLLREKSLEVKIGILESLDARPKLPQSILLLIASWLGDDVSEELKGTALLILRYHSHQSAWPEVVISEVIAHLKNPEKEMRGAAADAVADQSNWREGVLEDLLVLLKDVKSSVREAAAMALARQPTWTEGIYRKLTALLKDPKEKTRVAAAEALAGQSAWPEGNLKDVAAILKDSDGLFRRAAADALSYQLVLPESVFKDVLALLKDPEDSVRDAAAEALSRQPAWPEWVFKDVITFLRDSASSKSIATSGLERNMAEALIQQSVWPKGVFKDVIAFLRDYPYSEAILDIANEPTDISPCVQAYPIFFHPLLLDLN